MIRKTTGRASKRSRDPVAGSSRPPRRFRPELFALEGRALLAVWINQGPAPTNFGQDEGVVGTGTAASPANPVSGAVEAVAPLPNNADVLYAATVNGGVWKTTDARDVSPAWTPLTDNQVSTSDGDIQFDVLGWDAQAGRRCASLGKRR